MRTHSTLRRPWFGPAPHRHHRLIALVALLVLALLALPLLGQHSHASPPQPHHAASSLGATDCEHHHDQTHSAATDCHCVHACAGALNLAFAPATQARDYTAAAPLFAQPLLFAPAHAPAPPYRPPTLTDRMA